MQITSASQTTSEVQERVEGLAVNYVVEVGYTGADWPDLLADMRSWLDRRLIETPEFEHSVLGRGVEVRVGFCDEEHAGAFASAFSWRLQPTGSHPAVATKSINQPPDNDTGLSSSKGLTVSDDFLSETLQCAAKASPVGVSLMITRRQKVALRERGYTDEQIRDMKPEEAHRALGLID